MKFKFPSSGQQIADAMIVDKIIRGNSLRPLAPSNIQGFRDALGNLTISWVRRSRVGLGMIPGSDVPVGEERQLYKLEFYSGATLVDTYFVTAPQSEPISWKLSDIDTGTTPAISGDGSVSFIAGDADLLSRQVLIGDYVIDFQATAANDKLPNMEIRDLSSRSTHDPSANTPKFWQSVSRANTDPNTKVFDFKALGAPIYYDASYSNRIQLMRVGSQFITYRNYNGPGSPVEQISQETYTGPAQITIWTNSVDNEKIVKPTLTLLPGTRFFYSTDAQTKDFGSVQSSIKVIIYQVSAVVGAGPGATATL